MTKISFCFASAIAFLFCATEITYGQTTIDFENLAVRTMFENHIAGSTAGPFTIDGFDGMFTEDVTFTTDSVTGFVDTSSFGLGVNGGGGDPDTESFNIGETWEVSADHNLLFVSIDIGGLQTEETFRMQSDAWINLANINPDPAASVEYDALTGTFSLTDGAAPSDMFTLANLTGGTSLQLVAGVPVVFGDLTSTFGSNDDVELQSLTLFAIPEPTSSLGLLFLGFICGVGRSRRS